MIKEAINMLGRKAKDRVTGFEGVISSVSFDLYGCVCGIITPPKLNSPLSSPPSTGRLIVAGYCGSIARNRTCAVMTHATPARMAAANGGSSTARRRDRS